MVSSVSFLSVAVCGIYCAVVDSSWWGVFF